MEVVIQEKYAKEKRPNPLFQIKIEPLKSGSNKLVNAYHYPGRCFLIYYDPELDDKQLRVILAHELGHLFLCTLFDKDPDKKDPDDPPTEADSSVFGALAISDRTDFYLRKDKKTFLYSDLDKMLDVLCLTANRKKGRYNIS